MASHVNTAAFQELLDKARITINLTKGGSFELWLNEAGRDLLVKKLSEMNENHEHLHLSPFGTDDVTTSTLKYRPTDTLLEYGKIYLRTDEWDQKYFPHVMAAEE